MTKTPGPEVPSYLAGLRLAGRPVVVVGAGRVAERRLEALIRAQARVTVIAPQARLRIQSRAEAEQIVWLSRAYAPGDLADAWYVLAATDRADVNAAVATEAAAGRTFCSRADDATEATAWTPATAEVDGITLGVLAGRNPGRAVQIRALLVGVLRQLARRAA